MKTKESELNKIIALLEDQSEQGLSNIVLERYKILKLIKNLQSDYKSMRLMRDDYEKAVIERDELIKTLKQELIEKEEFYKYKWCFEKSCADEYYNNWQSLKARIDGGVRMYAIGKNAGVTADGYGHIANSTLILDDGVEL